MGFGFNPFANLSTLSKLGGGNQGPSMFRRLAGAGMRGYNAAVGQPEMNSFLGYSKPGPYNKLFSGEEDSPTPTPYKSLFPLGEMDTSTQPASDDDYLTNMLELSKPGPATSAYREHVKSMPLRENYKPSVMRRIGAALAGGAIAYDNPVAGIQAAEAFKYRPFNEAMGDYQLKGQVLGEQADIENADMKNRMYALQQARAMGLKYDEFELKRLETEAKMRTERTTAEAQMMRARAYAESIGKPNWIPQPQADGSTLLINPKNPSQFTKVPGNSVAAGQLGVARTNAATGQRNAATNARNAETNVQRANTYERATSDAHTRGLFGLGVQASRANQPPTPRVQQDAEDNALRAMSTDPVFSDFIDTDEQGYPVLKPDDGSEDYQDFLAALDAKVSEILSGTSRRAPRR